MIFYQNYFVDLFEIEKFFDKICLKAIEEIKTLRKSLNERGLHMYDFQFEKSINSLKVAIDIVEQLGLYDSEFNCQRLEELKKDNQLPNLIVNIHMFLKASMVAFTAMGKHEFQKELNKAFDDLHMIERILLISIDLRDIFEYNLTHAFGLVTYKSKGFVD